MTATALTNDEGARAHFRVGLATLAQRETIYRLRHDIYARELGQHAERADRSLRDDLDERNVYIVVESAGHVAGFISITPPGGRFSVDKYFSQDVLCFARGGEVFEIRLLPVAAAASTRSSAPMSSMRGFRHRRA